MENYYVEQIGDTWMMVLLIAAVIFMFVLAVVVGRWMVYGRKGEWRGVTNEVIYDHGRYEAFVKRYYKEHGMDEYLAQVMAEHKWYWYKQGIELRFEWLFRLGMPGTFTCGYCTYWREMVNGESIHDYYRGEGCKGCPLNEVSNCLMRDSLWSQFCSATGNKTESKHIAAEIYEIILAHGREMWERKGGRS